MVCFQWMPSKRKCSETAGPAVTRRRTNDASDIVPEKAIVDALSTVQKIIEAEPEAEQAPRRNWGWAWPRNEKPAALPPRKAPPRARSRPDQSPPRSPSPEPPKDASMQAMLNAFMLAALSNMTANNQRQTKGWWRFPTWAELVMGSLLVWFMWSCISPPLMAVARVVMFFWSSMVDTGNVRQSFIPPPVSNQECPVCPPPPDINTLCANDKGEELEEMEIKNLAQEAVISSLKSKIEELEDKRTAEIERIVAAREQELTEKMAAKVAAREQELEQALAARKKELEQALAARKEELKKTLAARKQEFELALTACKQKLERATAAREQEAAAHEQALAALKQDLERATAAAAHEQALAALEQATPKRPLVEIVDTDLPDNAEPWMILNLEE